MPETCAHARTLVGPALELADIVREHGAAYRRRHVLTPEQHAVLSAVARCRTAVLGGHLDVCLACGHSAPSYNSCRDRHCPKCQAVAQARWIEGRMARVLPIHYFHVVFTLPAELRPLAAYNRRQVFDLLFGAASATLLKLGQDPKHLGAELGITMVLHTWARDLSFHPHVHAIVAGGGLSPDADRWVAARGRYLFPVEVMGALFRGKLLAALDNAIARSDVKMPGGAAADPEAWDRLRDQLHRIPWVVYAKRPFGGAEQVIRYLGRYTHRVGISNQRLISMDERGVTFRTKEGRTRTLSPDAFLGRFLSHVLPKGFVKIRHYGLMASGNATTKLETARARIAAPTPTSNDAGPVPATEDASPLSQLVLQATDDELRLCPVCGARAVVRRPLPDPEARAPPVAA
jgi:Putative transposase/Transposase zinc-binding domain